MWVNALSGGGGIVPTWTPADITTRMWYDVSDASTVTLSATDITALADKSGNGYTLSSVATRYPVLVTAEQNGLDVARFDGSNDILGRGLAGSTFDAIFQNVGSGLIAVARKVTNASSRREIFLISTSTAGSARATLTAGQTANKSTANGRRLDANSLAGVASSTSVDTAAWEIQVGVFDWTNSNIYIYVNGVLEGTNTAFQTDGSTSNTTCARTTMGGVSSAASPPDTLAMPGDIGEVLVIENDISAGMLANVHTYLSTKWGIAI